MRFGIGRRLIIVFVAAIGGSVTVRFSGMMMVTSRCFLALLSRLCAMTPLNNGMQPRCTRRKQKLPKNQQPREVFSEMLEHALWVREKKLSQLRAQPVPVILTVFTGSRRKTRDESVNFIAMRQQLLWRGSGEIFIGHPHSLWKNPPHGTGRLPIMLVRRLPIGQIGRIRTDCSKMIPAHSNGTVVPFSIRRQSSAFRVAARPFNDLVKLATIKPNATAAWTVIDFHSGSL